MLPDVSDLVEIPGSISSMSPVEARALAQELGVYVPDDSDSAIRTKLRAAVFDT